MVYPCVYREHLAELLNDASAIGLSLCIQGTRVFLDICPEFAPVYPCVYREHVVVGRISADDVRFIPVYTGNTLWRADYEHNPSVYPCVYREHGKLLSALDWKFGLSLCIQGTQPLIVWFQQHMRFIPVYTGNTHSTKITSNI